MGMDGYLSKPIKASDLYATIGGLVMETDLERSGSVALSRDS